MAGKDMQANIKAFRNFVQEKGWSITLERELLNNDFQIRITDGMAIVPVDFFHTGSVLIQGAPSELKSNLKVWWYAQKEQSKPPALWDADTLTQTQATATELPPVKPDRSSVAHIGSDESGKGDYFGPLVIAAIYVNPQTEQQLQALNVCDSKLLPDNIVLSLADEIKTICKGSGTVIIYRPERYNQLYKETPNLNLLLARAHAQAITAVQKQSASELAIVDQFSDDALVNNALANLGTTIQVEQRPRAEEDTAVATASIVARAEFVKQIVALSRSIGIQLPKGASNPEIVNVGRKIVTSKGRDELAKFAKLHFKTTEAILQKG
jgi:ribonuclease HIII